VLAVLAGSARARRRSPIQGFSPDPADGVRMACAHGRVACAHGVPRPSVRPAVTIVRDREGDRRARAHIGAQGGGELPRAHVAPVDRAIRTVVVVDLEKAAKEQHRLLARLRDERPLASLPCSWLLVASFDSPFARFFARPSLAGRPYTEARPRGSHSWGMGQANRFWEPMPLRIKPCAGSTGWRSRGPGARSPSAWARSESDCVLRCRGPGWALSNWVPARAR
jgi:hypothetical protein